MAKCVADALDDLKLAQAKFQFAGGNDDELTFNKDDLVVITKTDEGGWWEGTCEGKIGWFPSNYVNLVSSEPEEVKLSEERASPSEDSKLNQDLIVKDIIECEKAHVVDLETFHNDYINPLKASNLLCESDCKTLVGNYSEIVEYHKTILQSLETESSKPFEDQRIGACFLKNALQMKEIYVSYCANHPWAANILSQSSDVLNSFMEENGAVSPGIRQLTIMLSKPFVHVEKYASQLKELGRHVEVSHIDHLDIMKATPVLQILAIGCHEVRKRKEMELEMLTSTIEGWEGDPISALGNVIIMSQVFVEKEDVERRERYFCLFPKDLVILYVTPALMNYSFEERHSVDDISAAHVEDTDDFFNAFQLKVANGDVLRVMTSSPKEKDFWMSSLKRVLGDRCQLPEIKPTSPVIVTDIADDFASGCPNGSSGGVPIPPSVTIERSDSLRIHSMPRGGFDPPEKMIRSYSTGSAGTRIIQKPTLPGLLSSGSSGTSLSPPKQGCPVSSLLPEQPTLKYWSFSRLRPTPPSQPSVTNIKTGDDVANSPRTLRRLMTTKRNNSKMRTKSDEEVDGYSKKDSKQTASTPDSSNILEEDMRILNVIEAYCFSAHQRQRMSSGSPTNVLFPPQVPPHFTYKPSAPLRNLTSTKRKSKKKRTEQAVNSDVAYLRDQVSTLQKQTLYLRENLEEERQARKQFEKILRKSLHKVVPDAEWFDDTGKSTNV